MTFIVDSLVARSKTHSTDSIDLFRGEDVWILSAISDDIVICQEAGLLGHSKAFLKTDKRTKTACLTSIAESY